MPWALELGTGYKSGYQGQHSIDRNTHSNSILNPRMRVQVLVVGDIAWGGWVTLEQA